MSYYPKRWKLAPSLPEAQLKQLSEAWGMPPLLVQILFNRGVTTEEAVHLFLNEEDLDENPFKMRGVPEAVTRIRQAIRRGESIAVYGDFDVDGITATAVLTETLQALGARVRPYIPNRFNEGYGLNKEALSGLIAEGVTLVITVDCGIRSPEEVSHARQLGADMIVTDHHSIGPDWPPAVAVINPKRSDCPYGFSHLAGVGVAFKLAQALLKVNGSVPLVREVGIKADDLLDLVALGTVADLAPLMGENRCLVRRGLRVLNEMRRPGLQAMAELAALRSGQIEAWTIGFVLGPRLNAAGRLDDAITSYHLLTCRDKAVAASLANELEQTNRERLRQTISAVRMARDLLSVETIETPILIAAHEEFPPGIVGLVAGRLMEEFYRPAVIIERKPDFCRGSARSIEEFDITAALDCCRDLLVRHGGHAAAAGFTVATENLSALVERLRGLAHRQLAGQKLQPTLDIDAEVPLAAMNWGLRDYLRKLEPCGLGNPYPVFVTRHLTVRNARTVGTEGQHLKLNLFDGRVSQEAIGFGLGALVPTIPSCVDIAYSLGVNEWNGEERLQLRIADIKPAE